MLPIQRSDVLALALSTYTTTTSTSTTSASLSPSAASSFGSCKNTFMASPPCRVSLSVSTSHILTACQKYCHRNGTERNGAELNSTQPNWTEVHCTSLSPSDYTGKDKGCMDPRWLGCGKGCCSRASGWLEQLYDVLQRISGDGGSTHTNKVA